MPMLYPGKFCGGLLLGYTAIWLFRDEVFDGNRVEVTFDFKGSVSVRSTNATFGGDLSNASLPDRAEWSMSPTQWISSIGSAVVNVDFSFDNLSRAVLAAFSSIVSGILSLPFAIVKLLKMCLVWILQPLAVLAFSAQLMVIIVHGILFLSCDIVDLLVRTFVPTAWILTYPHRWICGCIAMWLVVLAFASPLLAELVKQPIVILWAQAGFAVLLHRQALLGGSFWRPVEFDRKCQLLSSKLYRRFGRQRSLSAFKQGERMWPGVWFLFLLICYVASRLKELMQTPFWFAVMGVYFLNRMITLMRFPDSDNIAAHWKLLWTVTYGDYRAEDEEFCEDEYPECSVCLDSMCTSTGALVRSIAMRRRQSLSLSVSRVRPRLHASQSLSAMRSACKEVCKQTLRGIWGRVAILPCGHKFHAGCIHESVMMSQAKYQCPYCRGSFFDDWRDFQEYQKQLYHVGLGTITAVYFIKYLHDNMILSSLFLAAMTIPAMIVQIPQSLFATVNATEAT